MIILHPAELGFAVRQKLADWGYGARLFAQLVNLRLANLLPLSAHYSC